MSHTNETVNLGLPQFIASDKATWLGDVNTAFAKIDSFAGTSEAAVAGAVSTAEAASTSANAALDNASSAMTTASSAASVADSAHTEAVNATTVAGNALTLAQNINDNVTNLTNYVTTQPSVATSDILAIDITSGGSESSGDKMSQEYILNTDAYVNFTADLNMSVLSNTALSSILYMVSNNRNIALNVTGMRSFTGLIETQNTRYLKKGTVLRARVISDSNATNYARARVSVTPIV